MPHTGQEKSAIVLQYRKGLPIQELSETKQEHTFTYHEYEALLRKVTKLENIITIIKTVRCTVRAPLRERLCELGQFYGQYDVHTPCEALDVSRGPFTTTSSATNGATPGSQNGKRNTAS